MRDSRDRRRRWALRCSGCLVGDSQRDRRVGAVQHAPVQEMPNLQDPFVFDLLFRCFPEVGRGRFGPFLCHFHLLALAFPPSGWGLASDSGTIACLEPLW
jgi:hypothetical protein